MKISAKDFRIGNYVQECYSGIMVVDSICEQYVSLYKLGFEAVGMFNIVDVEPIELTEDWLLKFGFRSEESFCYELDDISINTSRELMFIFTKCKNNIELEICEYVHELQNLYFALTKKELTYEI